jgi:hypothetical protein
VSTIGDIRDYVKDVVEDIGRDFTKPDDDWMQVACLETEDQVLVIPLQNGFFRNGTTKDVLALVLAEAMRYFKARRYAVLLNVHGKLLASEEEIAYVRHEEMRIEQMPDAREMLLLVYGDAEEEHCISAMIERDGVNPPTLGEWREAEGFGGRFAGLNQAMRRVEERA